MKESKFNMLINWTLDLIWHKYQTSCKKDISIDVQIESCKKWRVWECGCSWIEGFVKVRPHELRDLWIEGLLKSDHMNWRISENQITELSITHDYMMIEYGIIEDFLTKYTIAKDKPENRWFFGCLLDLIQIKKSCIFVRFFEIFLYLITWHLL